MLKISDLTAVVELAGDEMSELIGGKRRYTSFGASIWKRSKAITAPHQEMPEEEEEPTSSLFGGFSSLSLW